MRRATADEIAGSAARAMTDAAAKPRTQDERTMTGDSSADHLARSTLPLPFSLEPAMTIGLHRATRRVRQRHGVQRCASDIVCDGSDTAARDGDKAARARDQVRDRTLALHAKHRMHAKRPGMLLLQSPAVQQTESSSAGPASLETPACIRQAVAVREDPGAGDAHRPPEAHHAATDVDVTIPEPLHP